MLNDIAPGSTVNVKVVKKPTTAAAAKTIVRILSKSVRVKAENERLRKSRKTHFRQAGRGGRLWNINVVKQHPVKGIEGESETLTATLDVLTDLRSVSRFVDVTKA
ncbi:MAG: hypothetical protein NTW19_00800 [Planctomycetota bacterium]|nr:hypothetical protein [Planctomycetota bacterium]